MDLILLDAIFKITKPQTNFLFNLCRQEDAHISEIQPTLYHHNKYYDKQLNNLINCLLLCTFNVSWSQERQRNLKPKVIRCLLIRGPEGSKDKTKYQAPATPLFSFLPLPCLWPCLYCLFIFQYQLRYPNFVYVRFGFFGLVFQPLSSEFCFSNHSICIALIMGYFEQLFHLLLHIVFSTKLQIHLLPSQCLLLPHPRGPQTPSVLE